MTSHPRFGVNGWLRPEEGDTLCEYARNSPGTIVEIGCFQGKSALNIARGLVHRDKPPKFYSVDPHTPVDGKQFGPKDMVQCYENLAKWPEYGQHVRRICAPSWMAARMFGAGEVSMLFIDGDHTTEGVSSDLWNWRKTLPIGGHVLFHDHGMASVKKAISQFDWLHLTGKPNATLGIYEVRP